MDRRLFLKSVAVSVATLKALPALARGASKAAPKAQAKPGFGLVAADTVSTDGHTLLCTFQRGGEEWAVYEDLRRRNGTITFISVAGRARVLPKTMEPVFEEPGPQYLGLMLKDIGMSARDLMADKLLANGEPLEADVRRAAPPMNSAHRHGRRRDYRPRWDTFVGTRECGDTTPVFPAGNTSTYHPIQYFKALTNERSERRHEGLVGGWMPAVHKVLPGDDKSYYYDLIVFGDVVTEQRFIVQTWHRTARIENGHITNVQYGHTYPAYDGCHMAPSSEAFYEGLLAFSEYWEELMRDNSPITLPNRSWADLVRYAFVKEQMVRPGGVYPKYGAVNRNYYGPAYDGFQDTFTMSFYSNMECGRLNEARDIFDNYFTQFVSDNGIVNMRGPETAQFGLTLSLIARYYNYTGDKVLLAKHWRKIYATATLLEHLHDVSLKLPEADRGYGLISGWCESDSCLMPTPSTWWKPYFANSAFAVRGWRDIAKVCRKLGYGGADAWSKRAEQLHKRLIESIAANTRYDMNPPYIGPLPGTRLTFMESIEREHPSEQAWAHRCYSALAQSGVLPPDQANLVIDCMRAYGATTMGVVANVEPLNPRGREILGFISYGYAHELLRLGRIDEYILFMFAHRYHDYSPGSWTAGEVVGITGGGALFCIPAQQTVSLLVRWALVFEDPDQDQLSFARALPAAWIETGKPVGIENATTRWGRVSYRLARHGPRKLVAWITLPDHGELPKRIEVSFRLPRGKRISSLAANGHPLTPCGRNQDTAVISLFRERKLEVVARLA